MSQRDSALDTTPGSDCENFPAVTKKEEKETAPSQKIMTICIVFPQKKEQFPSAEKLLGNVSYALSA